VQISNVSARGIGQIFGVEQRLAAKTGKHQAHQLGASRFDREARRKSGGGGEIVYATGFAICLKQFLNRVVVRRIHRTKYAPASG